MSAKSVTVVEMPRNDGPLPARVTLRESIYYQPATEQPTAVESIYAYELSPNAIGMYTAQARVGQAWRPLLPDDSPCSMIHVENLEALGTQVRATEEEEAALKGKVLEIGISDDDDRTMAFTVVRPGRSLRLEPCNCGKLMVRAKDGAVAVKYALTVIPA